jgi:DNA-binding NarL/FixJ family response regulator
MNAGVKLLLVDDHEVVRAGLRTLLQREADFEVIGEATNGRKAIERVRKLLPDVVVMDVSMPELNGIDATRQVIAAVPGVKVIGLSASEDDRMTIEMLRAGAAGHLTKSAAFEELVTAIRTVIKGNVYFRPSVVMRIAADSVDEPPHSAFERLSSREREVLQLIAEGKATKEVAAMLSVSVKTAETHRRNLMEKLHVDSVAELTKYAIREGLTST